MMRQIHCSYLDKTSLYLAYMPFIIGGGLFVRTEASYHIEEELELIVQLMDEKTPYRLLGKVVWLTPKGAQNDKPAGLGIQFLEKKARLLTHSIEGYLADCIDSTQPTDTL